VRETDREGGMRERERKRASERKRGKGGGRGRDNEPSLQLGDGGRFEQVKGDVLALRENVCVCERASVNVCVKGTGAPPPRVSPLPLPGT
jgi:hypothetical protein